MTVPELAPCPWGCQAGLQEAMRRHQTGHCFVGCAGCGCEGPDADTVEEARQLWNERATAEQGPWIGRGGEG